MAIPSGPGTEVLKVHLQNANDTTELTLINGVADHIYTILSITFCERAGNAEVISGLYITNDGGSDDFYIIDDQALGADETFVWNDRIVLSGTDELRMQMAATCLVDIIVSYIDQDWT